RADVRPNAVVSPLSQNGGFEAMALDDSTGFPSGPEFVVGVKDQLYWDPVTGKSQRNSHYSNNTQLNALADKQLRQLKPEDRKATYKEMEVIMADECYRLCQSTTVRVFFWDPALANAKMSIVNGSNHFMSKWWLA